MRVDLGPYGAVLQKFIIAVLGEHHDRDIRGRFHRRGTHVIVAHKSSLSDEIQGLKGGYFFAAFDDSGAAVHNNH